MGYIGSCLNFANSKHNVLWMMTHSRYITMPLWVMVGHDTIALCGIMLGSQIRTSYWVDLAEHWVLVKLCIWMCSNVWFNLKTFRWWA